MIQGVIGSILYLLTTACLMIVVALLFSGSGLFKTSESENRSREKILISIVFGLLAIAGTLMGTEVSGAIANVRELAPLMAGLIGGPISGMLAGIIGGIHRYSLGGFTALPCSVSTVLAGIISGIVSKRIRGRMYLLKGAILGFAFESAAMALILVLAQPLSQAISAVGQIAVPMITANTIGLVVYLFLLNPKSPSETKSRL